ncbi:hypothetical protein D3C84_631280 [compost metagenome]
MPQQRRANPAKTKHQTEEYTGNHPDIARHQFLGIHNNRRERRGEDEADDHAENTGPEQVDMRQQQREWRDAEDREPDHRLTPDLVADRPTEEGPRRHRAEKQEQVQLRTGHRQVEFLDQVEGEVTGEAGHVEVLGEHQQPEHHQRTGHAPLGQAVSRRLALF